MDEEIELKSLPLHIQYKAFEPQLIVGQCLELPFIIAKGKDVNEFTEQVKKYVVHFINVFPDKMKNIILTDAKTIETYNISEDSSNNGWIIKPLTQIK